MRYIDLILPHMALLDANLKKISIVKTLPLPDGAFDAEIGDGFSCVPMDDPVTFVPTSDGQTAYVAHSKMMTDDCSCRSISAAITRQFDLARRVGCMTFRPYWHAYVQWDGERRIFWTRNAWSAK